LRSFNFTNTAECVERLAVALCGVALRAQRPPSRWYNKAFLPVEVRRSSMHGFVEANIPPGSELL
jgi:hypothetical protein